MPEVGGPEVGGPAVGGHGSAWRAVLIRAVLATLALSSVVVGAWAQLAPRSFYDDFPGGGRAWVSVDGPYNEHLVRDVGGLNLALALLLGAAGLTMGATIVRVAAGAAAVYALPHLLYHLAHLEPYGTLDRVGNTLSLSLAAAGPVLVLVLTWRSPPSRAGARPRP